MRALQDNVLVYCNSNDSNYKPGLWRLSHCPAVLLTDVRDSCLDMQAALATSCGPET